MSVFTTCKSIMMKSLAVLGATATLSGCALDNNLLQVFHSGGLASAGQVVGALASGDETYNVVVGGTQPKFSAVLLTGGTSGAVNPNAGNAVNLAGISGVNSSTNTAEDSQARTSNNANITNVRRRDTDDIPREGLGNVDLVGLVETGYSGNLDFATSTGAPPKGPGQAQARGIAPGIGLQGTGTPVALGVAATGVPLAGGFVDGSYEYSGAFAWAPRADFSTIAFGTSTVTLTVASSDITFAITATSANNTSTTPNEAGSLNYTSGTDFTLGAGTGRFYIKSEDSGAASDSNGFKGAGASSAVHFEMVGLFSGARGQAVSGVFGTTGDTASEFSGGFVASGARSVTDITRYAVDGGGIATASYNFLGGASATPVYFVSGDYTQLYGHLNSPLTTADDRFITKIVSVSLGAASAGSDAVGRTKRVEGTASHLGRNIPVVSYVDPGGNANLLLIELPAARDVGVFFAAGGKPFDAGTAFNGTFKYVGTQVVGARGALQAANPTAIEISANFTTDTFVYSTGASQAGPVVAGDGTINATTGIIATDFGSGKTFTITPAGRGSGSAIAAEIRGRFSGVWQGLSGVVATTTTTGAQFGGGFTAYLPEAATLVRGQNPGIGTIEDFNLDSGDKLDLGVFIAANADDLVTAINTPATRSSALLASIKPVFNADNATADADAGGALTLGSTTFDFDGETVTANIFYDRDRLGRLVILGGTGSTSAIAVGVSDFSGELSGVYRFGGAYVVGASVGLHSYSKGSFTLAANFSGGIANSFRFSASTPASTSTQSSLVFTSQQNVTLAGGRFTATGGFFTTGSDTADDSDTPAVLYGVFGGRGGSSVAGIFTSTGGVTYAGGFIGAGNEDTTTQIFGTSTRAGLAIAPNYSIGTGAANGIVFAADQFQTHIAGANHASATQRAAALVARINPTALGARLPVDFSDYPQGAQARAVKRTGDTLAYGGRSFDVTSYRNATRDGTLLLLDGSNFTDTSIGSLIVAGGTSRPSGATLTGAFTWEGVLLLAKGADIADDPQEGWFRLTADFANSGQGSLTGAVDDTPGTATNARTLTAGISIAAATGLISKTGTFQLGVAGGGTTLDGNVSGYVSGDDAEAVSGVFATSGSSGAQFAGGFVGGAPVVSENVAAPADTDGRAIAIAYRATFQGQAQSAGSVYFLGKDLDTHRDALNNHVRDATRDLALLSNLNDTLTGGAIFGAGNINRFASVTLSYGSQGAQTVENVVVFEDVARNAKLYAAVADGLLVAGGTTLANAPTGQFDYEGVFVSVDPVASGALEGGTLREGTFTLAADFTANTFTFVGVTRTDPSDDTSAQTSKLEVTASGASTGTISAGTGRLVAGAAQYIEGAGSAKTDDARLEARFHGNGAQGVAGLFTTTDDAADKIYAGGFAGSLTKIVDDVTPSGFGGSSPATAPARNFGFASSNRLVITGAGLGPSYILTSNLSAITAESESATVATRTGAYLALFTSPLSGGRGSGGSLFADTGITAGQNPTNPAYKSQTLTTTLYSDWLGVAGVLDVDNNAVNAANKANTGDAFIAGGAPFVAPSAGLAGEYSWAGILVAGSAGATIAAPSASAPAKVTITATISGSSGQTFTVATTTATGSGTPTYALSGNGGIDTTTGELTASNSFNFATGGDTGRVALFGRLHGANAASLSAVFANSAAIGTGGTAAGFYTGFILASGVTNLKILNPGAAGTDHNTTQTLKPLLASGSYGIDSTTATNALVVAPSGSSVIYEANHPSKNVRDASLVKDLEVITGSFANLALPTVADRAASGDARAVSGFSGALSIGSKTGTVSYDSTSRDVVVYQDRSGIGKLAVVQGGDQLIAAAGTALSNLPQAGAYEWEGVHLIADAGSISTVTRGRFKLATTFLLSATTLNFTYTAATPATGGVINGSGLHATGVITTATGTFASSAFDLDGTQAGTNNIAGNLYGRLHGDGATVVSGAFLTSNATGTRYAGGFVGGGPQVVSTTLAPGTKRAGLGVATSLRHGTNTARGLAIVGDDYARNVSEAESPNTATRTASLLASIARDDVENTDEVSFAGTDNSALAAAHILTGGTFGYDGATITTTQWESTDFQARLFFIDGSGNSGTGSLFVAGGNDNVSGTLTGGYTWSGAAVRAAADNLGTDRVVGSFTLTANFTQSGNGTLTANWGTGAAATSLSVATSTDSQTGLISRRGAFALTLAADNVVNQGEVAGFVFGAEGQAVSGVFSSSAADGSGEYYAGGFAGGGPNYISIGQTGIDNTRIGVGFSADQDFGPNTADGIAFAAEKFNELTATANSSRDATRAGASSSAIAIVNTTSSGLSTGTDIAFTSTDYAGAVARTRTGGTISAGGDDNYALTSWTSVNAHARLVFLDGSADSLGSLYVAGGTPRNSATPDLSGNYTWEGVAVDSTAGSDFADASDRRIGSFRLTADFGNNGAGTLNARFAGGNTLSVGTTILASTGAIQDNGTYSYVISGGATISAGALAGVVRGGTNEAVAGVFANGSKSGAFYNAGGFAGGSPRYGYALSTGDGFVQPSSPLNHTLGEAQRDAFGVAHDSSTLFIVGQDYSSTIDAVNTPSDELRQQALLSSLAGTAAFTGGTNAAGLTRFEVGPGKSNTIRYGPPGTGGTPRDQLTGIVFQNSGRSVRLVLAGGRFIAGGGNVSNLPSTGSFTYEGVFTAASNSTFSSGVREGTFEMAANFTANTFTIEASATHTTGTGGTAVTVTSKLEAGAGNAPAATQGAIDQTEGTFTATDAWYIEGTGTTKTRDAYIAGRFLNAGATGVAAVFTTIGTPAGGDATYAGAFAGSVDGIVFEVLDPAIVQSNFLSAFLTSSAIQIPGGSGGASVIVTAGKSAVLDEANSETQATSDASYLFNLGTAGGTLTIGVAGNEITIGGVNTRIRTATVTGAQYKSQDIGIALYTDWLGVGRFAEADNSAITTGTNKSKTSDLFIAGGETLGGVGSGLTGEYTWAGLQRYARVNSDREYSSFVNRPIGLTADFGETGRTSGSAGISITNAGDGLRGTSTPASGGTAATYALKLDLASGVITGGGELRLHLSSASGPARFYGNIFGDRGVSISGAWANTGASVRQIQGAILASGAIKLDILEGTHNRAQTNETVLATGSYKVGNTTASGAYFVVPEDSTLLFDANHPSKNVRDASVIESLDVVTGTPAAYLAPAVGSGTGHRLRRTDGTIALGTSTVDVEQFLDVGGNASLVLVEGSSPFTVVGGKPASSSGAGNLPTSGAYTWQGLLHISDDTNSTVNRGSFEMKVTFVGSGGSSPTVTLTAEWAGKAAGAGGAAAFPPGNFSFQSNSVLTQSTATFQTSSISLNTTGASPTTGTFGTGFGRIYGAEAVSVGGVFQATAGAVSYSGAFVGSGKQDALSFTQTGDSLDYGTSGIVDAYVLVGGNTPSTDLMQLYLATNNLTNAIEDSSSPADATRLAAPVGALAKALPTTPTTWGAAGNLYTYASDSITIGGESVARTVYETVNGTARMVIVNPTGTAAGTVGGDIGGMIGAAGLPVQNLPTTGQYTYRGVLLSAAKNALGAPDTDTTFTMKVDFGAGGGAQVRFEGTRDGDLAPSGIGTVNTASATWSGPSSSDVDFPGGSQSDIAVKWQGRFHGDGAIAVSGLIYSAGDDGDGYAGALIGSGPVSTRQVARIAADSTGFARGNLDIDGLGARTTYVFTQAITDVLAEVNSPSDATLTAAILQNIDPALGDFTVGSGGTAALTSTFVYTPSPGTGPHTVNVTAYRLRAPTAALYVLDGTSHADVDSMIVASIADYSGSMLGHYRFTGTQIYGLRGGVTAGSALGMSITATFAAAGTNSELVYATNLNADGTQHANHLSGTFTFDHVSGFDGAFTGTLTNAASTSLTTYGRLSGANGLAVAGIFYSTGDDATTSYAGAFIGGRTTFGTTSKIVERPTSRTNNPGTLSADLVQVDALTYDVLAVVQEVDPAVTALGTATAQSGGFAAVRAGRFTSTVTTGTAQVPGYPTLGLRLESGMSDVGVASAQNLRIWSRTDGAARLYAFDSFVAVEGRPVSGTRPADGTYAYGGLLTHGAVNDQDQAGTGTFKLIATFAAGGSTATFAGVYGTQTVATATTAAIDTSTGRITSDTIDYTPTAGNPTLASGGRLDGRFNGNDWQVVSGVWLAAGATATEATLYGGGFIGSAAANALSSLSTAGEAAAGAGVAGGFTTTQAVGDYRPLAVLGPDVAAIVTSTNTSFAATSGIVNKILALDFGTPAADYNTATDVNGIAYQKSNAEVASVGGTIHRWQEPVDVGSPTVYLVEATTGDDFALATGAPATGIPTSGTIAYSGQLISGELKTVGGAVASTRTDATNGFRMSINFGSTPTFTFTGAVGANTLSTASGTTGTLSLSSGRFSSTGGLKFGPTSTAYANRADATLHGQIHGASALGISGLWHENATTATTRAGAFIGSVKFNAIWLENGESDAAFGVAAGVIGSYNVAIASQRVQVLRKNIRLGAGRSLVFDTVTRQRTALAGYTGTTVTNGILEQQTTSQQFPPISQQGSVAWTFYAYIAAGTTAEASSAKARLEYTETVGVSNLTGGSLYIASGDPLSGHMADADYVYRGTVVGGGKSAQHAGTQKGTFEMLASFGAQTFSFSGQSIAGDANNSDKGAFTASGSLDVYSGQFTSTDGGAFSYEDGGSDGAVTNGAVNGFVYGDATAVAGVFSYLRGPVSNNGSYGGFVGRGGPASFNVVDTLNSTGDVGVITGVHSRTVSNVTTSTGIAIVTPGAQAATSAGNFDRDGLIKGIVSLDPSLAASPFADGQAQVTATRRNVVLPEGSTSVALGTTGLRLRSGTVWEDRSTDARLYLLNPLLGDDLAIVLSDAVTGTLTGASVVYRGLLFVGAPGRLADARSGSFALTANFTAKTLTYSAIEGENRLGLASGATGTIDTDAGTFSITTAQFTAAGSGASTPATIRGRFSGAAGRAVSGVWYTNQSVATHAGAFIGNTEPTDTTPFSTIDTLFADGGGAISGSPTIQFHSGGSTVARVRDLFYVGADAVANVDAANTATLAPNDQNLHNDPNIGNSIIRIFGNPEAYGGGSRNTAGDFVPWGAIETSNTTNSDNTQDIGGTDVFYTRFWTDDGDIYTRGIALEMEGNKYAVIVSGPDIAPFQGTHPWTNASGPDTSHANDTTDRELFAGTAVAIDTTNTTATYGDATSVGELRLALGGSKAAGLRVVDFLGKFYGDISKRGTLTLAGDVDINQTTGRFSATGATYTFGTQVYPAVVSGIFTGGNDADGTGQDDLGVVGTWYTTRYASPTYIGGFVTSNTREPSDWDSGVFDYRPYSIYRVFEGDSIHKWGAQAGIVFFDSDTSNALYDSHRRDAFRLDGILIAYAAADAVSIASELFAASDAERLKKINLTEAVILANYPGAVQADGEYRTVNPTGGSNSADKRFAEADFAAASTLNLTRNVRAGTKRGILAYGGNYIAIRAYREDIASARLSVVNQEANFHDFAFPLGRAATTADDVPVTLNGEYVYYGLIGDMPSNLDSGNTDGDGIELTRLSVFGDTTDNLKPNGNNLTTGYFAMRATFQGSTGYVNSFTGQMGAKTISYTGTRDSSTGARLIDLATARFALDNAETDADGPGSTAAEGATILGMIHGTEGTALSGVWYSHTYLASHDGLPGRFGGFVGNTNNYYQIAESGNISVGVGSPLVTGEGLRGDTRVSMLYLLHNGGDFYTHGNDVARARTPSRRVGDSPNTGSDLFRFASDFVNHEGGGGIAGYTDPTARLTEDTYAGDKLNARARDIWYDLSGDAAIMVVASDGTDPDQIITVGTLFTGAPTTGTYNYKGVFLGGETGTINADTAFNTADTARGTFTMTADFAAGTITQFAGTIGPAASAHTLERPSTGTFNFDRAQGIFHFDNFEYKRTPTTTPTVASTIRGQFHGHGARAVSGIWYTGATLAADPADLGAFVGNRLSARSFSAHESFLPTGNGMVSGTDNGVWIGYVGESAAGFTTAADAGTQLFVNDLVGLADATYSDAGATGYYEDISNVTRATDAPALTGFGTPRGFETRTNNAGFYLVDLDGKNALYAAAKPIGDASLLSGTYVYRGRYLSGAGGLDVSAASVISQNAISLGFVLVADFDSNTFYILGREHSARNLNHDLTGSGTIDAGTGVFTSSTIKIDNNNAVKSTSAGNLYGRFGGPNAQAVAGVFLGVTATTPTASDALPGAFVGRKISELDINRVGSNLVGGAGAIGVARFQTIDDDGSPDGGERTIDYATENYAVQTAISRIPRFEFLARLSPDDVSATEGFVGRARSKSATFTADGSFLSLAMWYSVAARGAATMIYSTDGSTSNVWLRGDDVSNLQSVSRTYEYSGAFIGDELDQLTADVSEFTMLVDFANGTFTDFIENDSDVAISASGTVDMAAGTFASTSATIKDGVDASLTGRFHGVRAQGITGFARTIAASGSAWFGAFAGARTASHFTQIYSLGTDQAGVAERVEISSNSSDSNSIEQSVLVIAEDITDTVASVNAGNEHAAIRGVSATDFESTTSTVQDVKLHVNPSVRTWIAWSDGNTGLIARDEGDNDLLVARGPLFVRDAAYTGNLTFTGVITQAQNRTNLIVRGSGGSSPQDDRHQSVTISVDASANTFVLTSGTDGTAEYINATGNVGVDGRYQASGTNFTYKNVNAQILEENSRMLIGNLHGSSEATTGVYIGTLNSGHGFTGNSRGAEGDVMVGGFVANK